MTVAVSDEFKAKLKKSHRIVTKVEILQSGSVISLPDGVEFNLLTGVATEDKTNSIRRRADFEIIDKSGQLLPSDLSSIIAPNRNEIVPYRGIMTSAGAEYISLGVFGFRDVDINHNGSSVTLGIQGFDRSERISRESLTSTYIIPAGTALETAIQNLIAGRVSFAINYIFPSTGVTTPLVTLDRGSDPWKACTDLAAAAGYELFFDNTGQLILQPEPDPSVDPVAWTYASGSEAVISDIQRKLSFPTYNHVIESAEGTGIDVPFSAEAQDDNPASPTWVGYGDFPLFHVSSFFTNVAQCQAAADARLRKILGATENVTFNSVPNPALFASDVISIDQPEVKINTTTYTVDKVVTPMTAADGQNCVVRERVL